MSDRSPAFQRLCAAALAHFSETGYDGASLSTIAGLLGIKKASLYSHIAGKDELYLLLFQDALAAETDFARQCFAQSRGEDMPGAAYLSALPARYATSQHLRFLLRAAYLPPQAHREAITLGCADFYQGLAGLQSEAFGSRWGARFSAEDQALYVESWQGLVDGLSVELLYGPPERVAFRLKAMLRLMADALRA